MRDSRIILFVPDLAAAVRDATAVQFSVLEKFLSRAICRPVVDGITVLAERFGVPPEQLPVAPLEWLGFTGARDGNFWWRVDPVHLLVDRDQVVMLPRSALEVTQEEALALAATFNECYAADKFVLETPQPDTWYLRVPAAWRCRTWDPASVEGSAVTEFMPAGPDGHSLTKLMNEIQMLFFEHPVNRSREQAGKPVINSLWLWGGGVMPEQVARAPARIISNLPLVRGLATVAGRSCESWSDRPKPDLNGEDVLIGYSARHFDGGLEARLLRPCWNALMSGQSRVLECFPGRQHLYTLTRWDALRFWRRRRPLLTLLDEADDRTAD